jgi:hypothetical protein
MQHSRQWRSDFAGRRPVRGYLEYAHPDHTASGRRHCTDLPASFGSNSGRHDYTDRHCYPGRCRHVAARRRATQDTNAHTCVLDNRDRPGDDHALADSYDGTLPPACFLASVCCTGRRHHHTARLAPRDDYCSDYAGQLPVHGDRLCRTTSLSPSSPGTADTGSHALRAAPPCGLGPLYCATRRHTL